MHPKGEPRRRHGEEIKAKVLAACDEPGASVAAVALAHGLNANLVRKWRGGRGLKRTSLAMAKLPSVPSAPPAPTQASAPAEAAPLLAAEARFVPVQLDMPMVGAPVAGGPATARPEVAAVVEPATIDIELKRGGASLGIRWPASAAGDCALWLREVALGLLK